MKYSHTEIAKMLEPIFQYMKEVHPTNCKLIIEPFSAQLVYEHQDQIWLSEDFNKKFKSFSKEIQDAANSSEMQKIKEKFFPGITKQDVDKCCSIDELPDWAKDCGCDLDAAAEQLKDLHTLSDEEYINKWDKSKIDYTKYANTSTGDNFPKNVILTTN